jgi:hypothetical protein
LIASCSSVPFPASHSTTQRGFLPRPVQVRRRRAVEVVGDDLKRLFDAGVHLFHAGCDPADSEILSEDPSQPATNVPQCEPGAFAPDRGEVGLLDLLLVIAENARLLSFGLAVQ